MHRILAASVAIIFFGATLSLAQTDVKLGGLSGDPSLPIEVKAENLAVDQDTGTAVFTGSVVVGQGEMRLSADRVEVVYGEAAGEITQMSATGGVTMVTPTEQAEAENADYDLASGTVVMTGDVLLTQGASAISAARMVVNLEDGTAVMEGGVQTVFQQLGGN